MKKKLLALFTSLLVVCVLGFTVACSAPITVTISQETLTIQEYTEETLTATASNDGEITWTSSDETIATVDENGKVTGVAIGTATITANHGGSKAECEVTVIANASPIVAHANIGGVEVDSFTMVKGDVDTISARLKQGAYQHQVTFTFDSDNDSVITVTPQGAVTAVGVGEANLSYSTTFKGFTYDGYITIVVEPSTLLTVDMESVVLSAAEGGVNPNSETVTAILYDNNVEVTDADILSEITWEIEDDSIATVDNGVITGITKGQTTITVSYPIDNLSVEIDVVVELVEQVVNKEQVFSLYDIGSESTLDIDLGIDFDNVSKVVFSNDFTQFSNDTLNVPKTAIEKSGYYDVMVETLTHCYIAKVIFADKIITTASEFSNWPQYIRPKDWTNTGDQFYDGLVLLGADIEVNDLAYCNELFNVKANGSGTTVRGINLNVPSGQEPTYNPSFVGTFDGRGYTLSGITCRYGNPIFGVKVTGTIKNVAFVNCQANIRVNSGLLCVELAGGTMENIFIEAGTTFDRLHSSGADGSNNYGFLFQQTMGTAKVKNVVCVQSYRWLDSGNFGTGGNYKYLNILGKFGADTVVENAYALGIFNATTNTPAYASIDDFRNTISDLSSFGEMWDTSKGFPVFATAIGQMSKLGGVSAIVDNVATDKVYAGSVVELEAGTYTAADGKIYPGAQHTYVDFTINEVEGITLDKHFLTVAGTVPADTKVKVTATHILTGEVVEGEIIIIWKTTGEQVLLSAYDTETEYSIEVEGLEGDVTGAIFYDKNDAENVVRVNSLTVPKADLRTGYYSVMISTTEGGFAMDLIVADKVIYTAEEFQNWAKYIRPSNWNRGCSYTDSNDNGYYNIYDGLIVLGNDIDFGGQVYKTELATQANGIGGTWWLDKTTGEIYTEEVEGKSNLTNRYAGIFVGTFDGLGHTVYNIEIGYYGSPIFGEKLAGTVKNLAVTQVKFTAPQISDKLSGTIAGGPASITDNKGVVHAFEVHDIFVEGSFDYDLVYNSNPTQCGLVVGNCNSGGINYKYYAISAIANTNPKLSAETWGRNTSLTYGNGCDVIGTANNYTLVVLSKGIGKCNAYNPGEYVRIPDAYAQYFKVSGYWNTSKFPIMTSAMDHLTVLDFNETQVSVGENALTIKGLTNYSMGIMLDLWTVVSNTDGVTFDATTCTLNVADTVAVGTEITLTLTSKINPELISTMTFTMS